jgi:DNA-binding IclR family transcriptional regulator
MGPLTDRVAGELARAPLWAPTPDELALRLRAPEPEIREALESLVQDGIVERRGPLRRRYRLRSGLR